MRRQKDSPHSSVIDEPKAKGRKTEKGPLLGKCQLQKIPISSYPAHAEKISLILMINYYIYGFFSDGSKSDQVTASKHDRPCLYTDFKKSVSRTPSVSKNWVSVYNLKILNVASFRENKHPDIYDAIKSIISKVIENVNNR